ncbi:MAG: Demethylmenaquinone methyltransferase [Planctomycetes bacterium ADurb.Bin412]|nr:MAG: Demethylmenaquinone methyltransferase [Planctomycetes bacterium ADurb.Bin412]
MVLRIARLFLFSPDQTGNWVEKSYDRISSTYDRAWTDHMRDRSEELINQLPLIKGGKALDLTCGTGYVTNCIAEKMQSRVIGVDRSEGMLRQAQAQYSSSCDFVKSDILPYLQTVPANTIDLVTCCWGLGYSRPLAVLRQIRRVLKKGGQVGIIDNSLFSLAGVLYCSFLAFMENPDKLLHLMKFRFLMGSRHLQLWFHLTGLHPLCRWDGRKTYTVPSGQQAIERLRATGAAAGFEFAAGNQSDDPVFHRFAEIIEQKYLKDGRIPITHRYLAGIAKKC